MSLLSAVSRYTGASSIGTRFRKRRAKYVMSLIDEIYAEQGHCRILDIGGEGLYWKLFDEDYLRTRCVQVTISNIEYDPRHGR